MPSKRTLSHRHLAISLLFCLGFASGCGRMEALATVGERPTTVASAPGCGTAQATRGWHYRAQLDLGEAPPSSSGSGTKSAVRRTVRTSHVDSSFSLGDGLVFLLGLLFCAIAILALAAAGQLGKKNLKVGLALGAVAGVLSLATPVVGYLSGSVISVDNPTATPVRVTIDGTSVEVPPGSFTEVRTVGSTAEIRTESGGQLIEEVTLELDDHPGQTLYRALFGDGRYIYSVCGGNQFSLGHFNYG